MALAKWRLMPIFDCYLTQGPFIVTIVSCSYFIFAIGLDRFISVKYPIWYRNTKNLRYCMFHTTVGLGLGLIIAVLGFVSSTAGDEILSMCILGTAIVGSSRQIWLLMMLVLAVASGIAYFLAYRNIKCFAYDNHWLETKEKRLLNSVITVVVIYFVTLFSPVIFGLVVANLDISKETELMIAFYSVIPGSFNFNVNFFVYYIRSEEYRREFKKIWRFMWHPKSGAVGSAPVVILQVSPASSDEE